MVTVVIFINLAIALILLYVARLVWQLRKRLARIADTLIAVERSTHATLHGAPKAIYTGQQGIHKLRQGNEPLQLKIQRVRQVLSLLVLGQQMFRKFARGQRFSYKDAKRSQFSQQDLAKYR